jgi:tetratricopeptide (TPR) repeat protein
VIGRWLSSIENEISSAQKTKIINFVNGFPSGNSACPGYSTPQGASHITILNQAGAFFQAGFEAVFKGQIKTAAWCYLQALKFNPECPVFLNNAAFTLNQLRHFQDALVLLNYAVSRDASFASAWVNSAYAQAATGNRDVAIKAMEMAIVLNPEIEDYQKDLAWLYQKPVQKKKPESPKLDQALDLLAKGKETEAKKKPTDAQPGTKNKLPPQTGDSVEHLVSKMGSSYSADMEVLGQFIPILAKAGGEFLREAEWHEKKAKEPGATTMTKNIHTKAAQGYELLSLLFVGYIQEITGSWEKSEDLVGVAFAKTPARAKDYNPAAGLAPEFKLPPIAVGIDGLVFKFNPDNEEVEIEVGEGVILGFSASPKGWAVKIGVGIQAHGAVFGGEAAYFVKYDSIQGWMQEAKVSGECAGVRFEMPVWEQNYSWEAGLQTLGVLPLEESSEGQMPETTTSVIRRLGILQPE